MTDKTQIDFILHQHYTQAEIIERIGSQFEIDHKGQLIHFEKIVIFLLKVSTKKKLDFAQLLSPTSVKWETDQSAISDGEDLPRIPDPRKHEFYLFLAVENDSFHYCGKVHVGSYGRNKKEDGGYIAITSFTLHSKLPRSIWLTLGGYPAWSALVSNDYFTYEKINKYYFDSDEEISFAELINQICKFDNACISLERYEEDSLMLIKNKRRGHMMYTRNPGDPGLYVETGRNLKEKLERFPVLDFEVDWSETVTIRQGIFIMSYYFKHGEIPTSFKWKELD